MNNLKTLSSYTRRSTSNKLPTPSVRKWQYELFHNMTFPIDTVSSTIQFKCKAHLNWKQFSSLRILLYKQHLNFLGDAIYYEKSPGGVFLLSSQWIMKMWFAVNSAKWIKKLNSTQLFTVISIWLVQR